MGAQTSGLSMPAREFEAYGSTLLNLLNRNILQIPALGIKDLLHEKGSVPAK